MEFYQPIIALARLEGTMPRDMHGREFEAGAVCRLPHGVAKIQGFFSGNANMTLEEAKQVAMRVSTCKDPKVYYANQVEVLQRPGLLRRLWRIFSRS